MKRWIALLVLVVSCAHAPIATALTVPADAARIRFDTGVSDETVADFKAKLDAANASGAKSIVVEIDTGGGSVGAGQEMSKAIERSKAPVTCVVDGMAASMGLYILQSCHTRVMTSRSLLMGHEPAGLVRGQPDDMAGSAELLKKLSHAMASWIVHRTKISVGYYEAGIAHGHAWWMTADEALEDNFVDEVIDVVL